MLQRMLVMSKTVEWWALIRENSCEAQLSQTQAAVECLRCGSTKSETKLNQVRHPPRQNQPQPRVVQQLVISRYVPGRAWLHKCGVDSLRSKLLEALFETKVLSFQGSLNWRRVVEMGHHAAELKVFCRTAALCSFLCLRRSRLNQAPSLPVHTYAVAPYRDQFD